MPGVVYTKAWIVRLMLDMAGYVEQANLANGVAIEPSCGCGAFLEEMVTRLVASAKSHGCFNRESIAGSLRAFDVDAKAVEQSKNKVVLLLSDAGLTKVESEEIASTWIQVGDTLLKDLPKADWVIGNPPYVRSSQIDRERRKAYAGKLDCVTMGTDLYIGFYEVGLRSLKEDGKLCFICSDRWLQNRYGSRLRFMLADGYSVNTHIRLHDVNAFEDDVSAYPAITLITRGESDLRFVDCPKTFCENDVEELKGCLQRPEAEASRFELALIPRQNGGDAYPLANPQQSKLVAELAKQLPTFEEAGMQVGIGLASGCDDVFVVSDERVVEQDRLLPLFYMRDYRDGKPQTRYLVNPWDSDGNLVSLDDYPKLKRYLAKNSDALRKRHVAKAHPTEWYRTLDKLNNSLFGKQLLLFPDMAAKADPVLSDGTRYPHHNCYWLTPGSWDIEALGGLLMSDIAEAFVDAYGVKMRGKTLRFQAQYLRMIHVPRFEDVPEKIVRDLAEAFRKRDREAACEAARKAYKLAG